MPTYVDGYVLVVKKKDLAAYRRMAQMGGKLWRKHGALDYKECVIDDPKPKHVVLTFPKMIKAKNNEVVIFSFITFKSKAHRVAVNAKNPTGTMRSPGWFTKLRGWSHGKAPDAGFGKTIAPVAANRRAAAAAAVSSGDKKIPAPSDGIAKPSAKHSAAARPNATRRTDMAGA
jgi:uncharacterized protein YbaA (DUF1428 family)